MPRKTPVPVGLQSRGRIERSLARLADGYGEGPVREEPREAPPAVDESIRERLAGDARRRGVWTTDEAAGRYPFSRDE